VQKMASLNLQIWHNLLDEWYLRDLVSVSCNWGHSKLRWLKITLVWPMYLQPELKMKVKILILYILLSTRTHSSTSAILFQVRIMAKMEPRCPGGTLKCYKLMKSEHSVLCINIISIPYMVIRYSAQCFLPMPH
jgi:hypothetical protein